MKRSTEILVIMSVDVGKARTGVALCDKMQKLAFPLCVVNEKNQKKVLIKICDLASEHSVEKIVVGLPKNMNGSEGESAVKARKFAEELSRMSKIETVLQDERGTTITAHNYLNVTDTRGKKRKNVVDSVAATIILQNYLDRVKTEKC